MTTTGQNIRAARASTGITRRKLALAIPCDPSTVTLWEQGRRMPLPAWLARVASILNTTPELLQGSDYHVHPNHNGREIENLAPLPPLQAEQPECEYENMTSIVQFLRSKGLGSIDPQRVHDLIQKEGMPAYENKLRKNMNGEPTLLFKRPEVIDWLSSQITPLRKSK